MRKLFHYLVCICFIMILLVGLVPTVSADTKDSSEDMITVLSTDDDDDDDEDDDIYVYNGAVYELSDDREADYIRPKNKKQKSVVIPATIKKNGKTYRVTAIEDNAFKGNTALTNVTIGGYVEDIGDNAFRGCVKLKKITIPAKVDDIGSNVFNGCKKLKTITIKSKRLSADDIENNAFKGITKYTTIKVPKSKLSAYKKMFRNHGLSTKVSVKGY